MDLIQKKITKEVLSIRKIQIKEKDNVPRFSQRDTILCSDGIVRSRKKVILMTYGCSVPTCTMCPFTDLNNYGINGQEKDYMVSQVKECLSDDQSFEVLALYNDGSFFAKKEIPDDILFSIGSLVKDSGIKILSVESLPQFIKRDRLEKFLECIGDVKLEIGIGLQSSDTFIRETCINTRITQESFENAISLMNSLRVLPKIYLMQKPPFLTDEESITDIYESLKYLVSLGIYNATICPTRVSKGTLAMDLYNKGLYYPPNLWSVVKALELKPKEINVRVACVNLKGSDFESIFPSSCEKCDDTIIDELEHFSIHQEFSKTLECECKSNVSKVPIMHDEIKERIEQYLSTLSE